MTPKLPDCPVETCMVAQTQRCPLKGEDYPDCPNYNPILTKALPDATLPRLEQHFIPKWTGNALSPYHLGLVGGLHAPTRIAVVGLPRSGKTSFLTSAFIRLRHEPLGDMQFAGSLTLQGWANLTRHAEWTGDIPAKYPPRTSGDQREPGYLHLSFRDASDTLLDLLMADTPGEWYEDWVDFEQDATDPENPAPWTVLHCDTVLLVVDSPTFATSSPERNSALYTTIGLADRIAAIQQHVVVVYAKADEGLPDSAQFVQLKAHLEDLFPGHTALETSSVWESENGKGVLEALLACFPKDPLQSHRVPDPAPILARWFQEKA